jgi:hypothetical protein
MHPASFRLTAVCSAACVAFATVPARASTAPIHVTTCNVVPQDVPRRGEAQETIRISFSIDGSVAADEAHFVVTLGSSRMKGFIARGLFSQGVIIADRLLESDMAASEFNSVRGKLGCFPTYLHFVNGATWSAAESGAPAQ